VVLSVSLDFQCKFLICDPKWITLSQLADRDPFLFYPTKQAMSQQAALIFSFQNEGLLA